jgi:RES domain-containing protein
LKVSRIVYRAHDPQWAFAPDSGEGARIQGGRFNPKGIPTLYLSLSVRTCGLEMGHGFKNLFPALTLVSYEVEVDDVVDLTSAASRRKARVRLEDLGCAWRDGMGKGIKPASWIVTNKLRAEGASGILVPSFANGAGAEDINLVLWRWGAAPPYRVVPYDPAGRLPKNQQSWT